MQNRHFIGNNVYSNQYEPSYSKQQYSPYNLTHQSTQQLENNQSQAGSNFLFGKNEHFQTFTHHNFKKAAMNQSKNVSLTNCADKSIQDEKMRIKQMIFSPMNASQVGFYKHNAMKNKFLPNSGKNISAELLFFKTNKSNLKFTNQNSAFSYRSKHEKDSFDLQYHSFDNELKMNQDTQNQFREENSQVKKRKVRKFENRENILPKRSLIVESSCALRDDKLKTLDQLKPKECVQVVVENEEHLMKRSSIQISPQSMGIQNFTNNFLNSKSLTQSRKENQIGLHSFQKIKDLGKGKYGTVMLVRQKLTNYICALKMIEKKTLKQEQITEQFIRQVKIQSYLNHPNIIKMFGFFEQKQYFYIILQAGTGGQFYHYLKKSLNQTKIAHYMRQVCFAVRQLHSHRIIHRDIKPENIIVQNNVLKLCDFGWSVKQDTTLRSTFCGTPLYVCPQILKGQSYDEKIDIWSIGIMMYQMLVGQNPFKITKQQELIKIISDQVKIPEYIKVSKQAQNFLNRCLRKNPHQRANIRQLVEHQFFKKHPDKQAEKNKLAGL